MMTFLHTILSVAQRKTRFQALHFFRRSPGQWRCLRAVLLLQCFLWAFSVSAQSQSTSQGADSTSTKKRHGISFSELEQQNQSTPLDTAGMKQSGVSVDGLDEKIDPYRNLDQKLEEVTDLDGKLDEVTDLEGKLAQAGMDSLAQLRFLQVVDSLTSRASDFRRQMQSQDWSREELESKVTEFLNENDALIKEVEAQRKKIETSPQTRKLVDKSKQVEEDVRIMRTWKKEQVLDTLNRIQESKEFRQAMLRNRIDVEETERRVAFINEQRKQLTRKLEEKQAQLAAATNQSEWPLSREYYESRVMGYYDHYRDSVTAKVDSVTSAMQVAPPQSEVLQRGARDRIDSLTHASLDEAWLKMKSTQAAEDIEEVEMKRKALMRWRPDYAELIVGLNEQDKEQLLLSPNVAHELFKDFFVGVGGEFTLYLKDMRSSVIGFKGLVRWHPTDAFYYLQGESVSYFPGVSFSRNTEVPSTEIPGYQHAINLGAGGMYPVNSWLYVNGAVLYRVMEATVTPNASPFIFRLGFTIK